MQKKNNMWDMIAEELKIQKITQKQLAKMINISSSALSQYKHGKIYSLSQSKINEIFQILQINPNERKEIQSNMIKPIQIKKYLYMPVITIEQLHEYSDKLENLPNYSKENAKKIIKIAHLENEIALMLSANSPIFYYPLEAVILLKCQKSVETKWQLIELNNAEFLIGFVKNDNNKSYINKIDNTIYELNDNKIIRRMFPISCIYIGGLEIYDKQS